LTQEQILLAILGALLIANVVLVASIPFRIRRGRRSLDPVAATEPDGVEDARAVAPIEEFVATVSPEGDRSRQPLRSPRRIRLPGWRIPPRGRERSARSRVASPGSATRRRW
jgi:hypothetical protein